VAIFSFFGKKPPGQEQPATDPTPAKKTKSRTRTADIAGEQDEDALSQSVLAQRHIARATERKIDAIEFEMSRDMGRVKPSMASPSIIANPQTIQSNSIVDHFNSESPAHEFAVTLPLIMPATDYFLGQATDVFAATLSASETVPILEEASILFATGQNEVAEQMLQAAISQDELGNMLQVGWFMLFDLYQITKNQDAFDNLSLEYASKFETSPPVWQNSIQNTGASIAAESNSTPSVTFPAQLDGNIIKLLEKLQNLSKQSKSLRLDFGKVQQVDPIGCGLLLRSLKNLKKSSHDLMLVGAQDFADKIRAILEVGRRDETEAPWLLLLEILQLLQFESIFEETSIDYCITFEVSPPSFEAPKNKVTAILPEVKVIQAIDEVSDRFVMPAVVEGKTDTLISQIAAHAEFHKLIFLDCSKLERVEFGASAQLLSGLVPIAGRKDTVIQFHDVNYLVTYLFNAMGLKNVAAIFPRKH
jgi:ABC-type transporter Mla MlaB component